MAIRIGAKSTKIVLGMVNRELADKLLKDRARDVSIALGASLPEGFRHVMIIRDDEGRVAFVTDASREAAIDLLREVLKSLQNAE